MDLQKFVERSTTILLGTLITLLATVYAVSYAMGVETTEAEVQATATVPAAIVVTEAPEAATPATKATVPAAIVVTEAPATKATTPAAIIVR